MTLKQHLSLVALFIFLLLLAATQIFKVSTSSTSPDIYYLGSGQTAKASSVFSVKISSFLPLVSVKLKTDTGNNIEKIVLSLKRTSSGVYSGSFEFPEAPKVPKTYSFRLYVDGIKTKQVLRVAFTNATVVAAPDPGEAGKETLEGIDSNKDGVRDDLEREIIFLSPDREDVRRVLRAIVKKMQLVITTEGDHEYFKDLMVKSTELWDCWKYKVYGDNAGDYTGINYVWDSVENTEERKNVFIQNDTKGKPYTITLYGTNESCINAFSSESE